MYAVGPEHADFHVSHHYITIKTHKYKRPGIAISLIFFSS